MIATRAAREMDLQRSEIKSLQVEKEDLKQDLQDVRACMCRMQQELHSCRAAGAAEALLTASALGVGLIAAAKAIAWWWRDMQTY
jgi:hypothetical protein